MTITITLDDESFRKLIQLQDFYEYDTLEHTLKEVIDNEYTEKVIR